MNSFEQFAETASWFPIGPQLFLLLAVFAVLGYDLAASPKDKGVHGLIAITGLSGAGFAVALQYRQLSNGVLERPTWFSDMLVLDGSSIFVNVVLLVVLGLGLLFAWPMINDLGTRGAETMALMMLSTVGFMFMGSSINLMMMFIGLEIGSIALYVLAGIARDKSLADEAAVKYFLLGSFASAVFVYGVALFYATTGSVQLTAYFTSFGGLVNTKPGLALLSMALMAAGLLFKVTAAPFHSWAPDVYQGAPAGVTGFMSASAKVGGFAGLMRVMFLGFSELAGTWQPMLAAVAAFSIVLGTLLAITQEDLRRMLAYSGVAHAGFILMGVASGRAAVEEILFYLAVYSILLVSAFGITSLVSGSSSSGSARSEYVGLGKRSPLLAGSLALVMIAMSGMPVTSGFMAKFGIFQVAWSQGLAWLVLVALIASVAAFFFYLRVVVDMFMREGEDQSSFVIAMPARIGLLSVGLLTILFGTQQKLLLDLIANIL